MNNIVEEILIFRQKGIKLYKDYEKILFPMIKFFLVLITLLGINSSMGYMSALNKATIAMAIAFLAMFLSIKWIIVVLMIITTSHMIAFNTMVGLGTAVFFILLYAMYVRLYPAESILIIITMIALNFNIGYAVPLIAALFGGFACIVPMTLGILFSYIGKEMSNLLQGMMGVIPEDVVNVVISIINQHVLGNTTMLVTIAIFIVTFAIVYIIRRLSIDYAAYIGIAVGGAISLLGFIIATIFLEININVLLVVVMTILSILLAVICEFTSKVLDYSRSEVVQFEDEDNYYYVKVVPKVSMSINKKKVEQVYTTTTKEKTISLEEDGI